MTALDYSRLRHKVVLEARVNLGYGDRGSNSGPFIRALGGREGAEWCALFAGYCYRRAYEALGLPFPTWLYRRPGILETSAKALTRGLGRGGSIYRPHEYNPRPGDLVCWTRGLLGWQGHVGIVTEGGKYISGNEGRLGTVTERFISANKLTLWRFASIEPEVRS